MKQDFDFFEMSEVSFDYGFSESNQDSSDSECYNCECWNCNCGRNCDCDQRDCYKEC